MSHLNTLIVDLALILTLAGAITLLFKWLKQPVVLGYIVAGFVASHHLAFMPTISNTETISVWAEIGIIVLLFSLGLEFSIKKLLRVGGSACITASIIVVGMMCVGFSVGRALQMALLDSIFLGAMLSMSSTTIIIKAFSDLNLRKNKFATYVFGVLIVEDLFAVLMMVLLSSIAVHNSFEGGALLASTFKLLFFLLGWFILGVFLLPTLLKRVRKYLNTETLLILSMGLCLGMVVLASLAGFSAALGAFVMGSLLAGTNQAERIEKVVRPVKDLFGAVFFVSVGMMVSPEALLLHWQPILILSGVVIVGQILFATGGMLLSGQPLSIAIQSGFSLAQIGEFAFIIATLGMSLKVINPTLYPIVVAVSVVTTFTTPYLIRASLPVSNWIERILPPALLQALSERATQSSEESQTTQQNLLLTTLLRVAFYATLLLGVLTLSTKYLYPMLLQLTLWGASPITALLTLAVMSPLLWGLSLKLVRENYKTSITQRARIPFLVLTAVRILLAVAFPYLLLTKLYPEYPLMALPIAISLVLLLLLSRGVQRFFQRLETRFLDNFHERELRRTGKKNNLVRDMHLAHMRVHTGCPFIGRRLKTANIHRQYGVIVVTIKRGKERINLPSSEERIFPGDVLGIVADDAHIQHFLTVVEREADEREDGSQFVDLQSYPITSHSPLNGKSLAQSDIRSKECLVVGIERGENTFLAPAQLDTFQPDDVVWLVGTPQNIAQVMGE